MAAEFIYFWTMRRTSCLILLLLVAACVLLRISPGLTDPDYYWHLKAGEVIYQSAALPPTDPFSYSFGDQRWVMDQWLFQLGLHLWHRAFGPAGVLYGTVALVWLTWCVAFLTADALIRRPAVTLLFAFLFGAGLAALAAPRPQIASYLMFALYCGLFFAAKYHGRQRGLLLAPVLMVVWGNLHGAYAMGIALMAAAAGGEWLNHIFARQRRPEQLRFCLRLTAAAVFVLLASLVTPYGIERWQYPLEVLDMQVNRLIGEWRSILTFPVLGEWYLAGGLAFLLLTLFRRSRPDASELLIPTALFAAGLMQARHTPFASIALLIFVAPAIRDGALANLASVLRRGTAAPADAPPQASPETPPRAAALALWGLAAGVAAILVAMAQSGYLRQLDRMLPAAAAAGFVDEADLKGRMLNEYDDGGYLIARFHPDRKVFIDSRSHLYGDVFVQQYYAVLVGAVDPRQMLEAWQFDYAILNSTGPLRWALPLIGNFAVVFDDGTRSVLVRRDGADAGVLDRYPELGR